MTCEGAPDLVLGAINLHKSKTNHKVVMIRINEKTNTLLEYYDKAYEYVMNFHANEIAWQENRDFSKVDLEEFYREYVWVVLCSGFSVVGARKIMDLWLQDPTNFELIKHRMKRKAIKLGFENAESWLKTLQSQQTDIEKLEYLQTLPHIGPVTRYHLAKNLGIDVAKPDVHLVRIANEYGWYDVQEMCEMISKEKGQKVSVVDVVLWRYRADREGSKWAT